MKLGNNSVPRAGDLPPAYSILGLEGEQLWEGKKLREDLYKDKMIVYDHSNKSGPIFCATTMKAFESHY